MILVTGGTGLLGSHLLLQLINTEEKIRVLKRKSSNISILNKLCAHYKIDENLLNKIEWLDGDLMDVVRIKEVCTGIDTVFDKLFDNGRRSLDHLSRRDLVDQRIRKPVHPSRRIRHRVRSLGLGVHICAPFESDAANIGWLTL